MNRRVAWQTVFVAAVLAASGVGRGNDPSVQSFIRGDINQNERLEITDAVLIFLHLFAGHEQAAKCFDAADVDNDGEVAITDGIVLLGFLFQRGRPPSPPRECGLDIRTDDLDCASYAPCEPEGVFFYGQPVDADDAAILFVIDRSSSMQSTAELAIAKREVISAICSLPDTAEFAVIFSDQGVLRLPAAGVPATVTPENVEAAVAWVASVQGGSGSCPRDGFMAALEYSESSSAGRQLVHYVGDGGGTCPGFNETQYLRETLSAVTGRNNGRAEIHTIGVLVSSMLHENFLRALAEQNGGTFRLIRR